MDGLIVKFVKLENTLQKIRINVIIVLEAHFLIEKHPNALYVKMGLILKKDGLIAKHVVLENIHQKDGQVVLNALKDLIQKKVGVLAKFVNQEHIPIVLDTLIANYVAKENLPQIIIQQNVMIVQLEPMLLNKAQVNAQIALQVIIPNIILVILIAQYVVEGNIHIQDQQVALTALQEKFLLNQVHPLVRLAQQVQNQNLITKEEEIIIVLNAAKACIACIHKLIHQGVMIALREQLLQKKAQVNA